jgi:hypothetical protein
MSIALPWLVVVGATPANAVACASNARSQLGGIQDPADGNLFGVRAPIENRLDGLVCQSSLNLPTASWIGVEGGGVNEFAQIGFAHHWSSMDSRGYYCRFWAFDTGSPHYYGCDAQIEGQYVYYKILVVGPGPVYHFEIYDCGTSGSYSAASCGTSKNSTEGTSITNMRADMGIGEATSACEQWITGSGPASDPTPDKQNIGKSGALSELVPDSGGSWSTPNIDALRQGTDCSEYDKDTSTTNGIILLWDERNTS